METYYYFKPNPDGSIETLPIPYEYRIPTSRAPRKFTKEFSVVLENYIENKDGKGVESLKDTSFLYIHQFMERDEKVLPARVVCACIEYGITLNELFTERECNRHADFIAMNILKTI